MFLKQVITTVLTGNDYSYNCGPKTILHDISAASWCPRLECIRFFVELADVLQDPSKVLDGIRLHTNSVRLPSKWGSHFLMAYTLGFPYSVSNFVEGCFSFSDTKLIFYHPC